MAHSSRTIMLHGVQESAELQLNNTNGRLARQPRRAATLTHFQKVLWNANSLVEIESFDPFLRRIKMAYGLLPFCPKPSLEFRPFYRDESPNADYVIE